MKKRVKRRKHLLPLQPNKASLEAPSLALHGEGGQLEVFKIRAVPGRALVFVHTKTIAPHPPPPPPPPSSPLPRISAFLFFSFRQMFRKPLHPSLSGDLLADGAATKKRGRKKTPKCPFLFHLRSYAPLSTNESLLGGRRSRSRRSSSGKSGGAR